MSCYRSKLRQHALMLHAQLACLYCSTLWHMHACMLMCGFACRHNIEKWDRPLYAHIWKRIISSGHRTLDGDKADFYFLPTDFRSVTARRY